MCSICVFRIGYTDATHISLIIYTTRSILIQKKTRLINEQKWTKVGVRNSKPKRGKLKTCMELFKLEDSRHCTNLANLVRNPSLMAVRNCSSVSVATYICDTHTYPHTHPILALVFLLYPPSSVFLKWRKPISI